MKTAQLAGEMLALSIRQPWAWLIVNGHKDVENRTWRTKIRGRVLVHAAKKSTYPERLEWLISMRRIGFDAHQVPDSKDWEVGGIVGSVEIVDCVEESDSRWHAEGQWGFVLRNAQPLPFLPCKGRLGFFEVPSL